MHNLSKISILAVVAGLSSVPAMAAPQNNNFSGHSTVSFCAMHQTLPQCVQFQAGTQTQGTTQNQGTSQGQTGTQSQNGSQDQNGFQGQNGFRNGYQGRNDVQSQNGYQGPNGDRNGGFGRRTGDYGDNGGAGFNFNFSSGERDRFHQRFRGFDFGSFGTPTFSISIGGHVPHSYGLRHVPRSIYAYYPQFRGYLFFVGRRGDLVIVSPDNYRIVVI